MAISQITSNSIATGAVSASDLADGSITTAKIADTAVTNAKIDTVAATKMTGTLAVANGGTGLSSGFANGITGADQWRITSNTSVGAGAGTITANWERVDTDSPGFIGSGMTQSSGNFTFPTTGKWLVLATIAVFSTTDNFYAGGYIEVTSNGGSTWDNATDLYQNIVTGGATKYATSTFYYIVDVTSTSNVKVRLAYDTNTTISLRGNTNASETGMTFIRLGD